jgi:hypothetical protein
MLSVASDYIMKDRASIANRGENFFSNLCVHIGSEDNPAF